MIKIKPIILLFSLLFGLTLTVTVTKWTPQILKNIKPIKHWLQVYDPDNFIQTSNEIQFLEKIEKFIRKIKELKKFEVYVFIVTHISDEYNHDIAKFTSDLANQMFLDDPSQNLNSIFLFFSIGDRQNRIRTGRNVLGYLNDSKVKEFLNDIVPSLKKGKFSHAIASLLRAIYKHMKVVEMKRERINRGDSASSQFQSSHSSSNTAKNNQTPTRDDGLILVFTIIIIIVSILVCSSFINSSPPTADIQQIQLSKINEIIKCKVNKQEVIFQYCLVCLDKIDSNLPNSVREVMADYCGHVFHKECINEWRRVNEKECPTCQEQMGFSKENYKNIMLSENLLNIQTNLHPKLKSSYEYSHSENSFSWNYPQPKETIYESYSNVSQTQTENATYSYSSCSKVEESDTKSVNSGGASSSW